MVLYLVYFLQNINVVI